MLLAPQLHHHGNVQKGLLNSDLRSNDAVVCGGEGIDQAEARKSGSAARIPVV
jgi:hypothetical protein